MIKKDRWAPSDVKATPRDVDIATMAENPGVYVLGGPADPVWNDMTPAAIRAYVFKGMRARLPDGVNGREFYRTRISDGVLWVEIYSKAADG